MDGYNDKREEEFSRLEALATRKYWDSVKDLDKKIRINKAFKMLHTAVVEGRWQTRQAKKKEAREMRRERKHGH